MSDRIHYVMIQELPACVNRILSLSPVRMASASLIFLTDMKNVLLVLGLVILDFFAFRFSFLFLKVSFSGRTFRAHSCAYLVLHHVRSHVTRPMSREG